MKITTHLLKRQRELRGNAIVSKKYRCNVLKAMEELEEQPLSSLPVSPIEGKILADEPILIVRKK